MIRSGLLCVSIFAVATGLCCAADAPVQAPRTPDCVFVGTPNDVVERMVAMAKITKEDLVCDPGCGDARMLVAAAKLHGCRGVGYEIDPDRIAEAQQLIKKRRVESLVRIEVKDIFTVDYRNNTVILMYLLPDMITRLLPQFEQLRPGSRIVAHDYEISGIEPDEVVDFKSNEDNVSHALYLYTTPLKKKS